MAIKRHRKTVTTSVNKLGAPKSEQRCARPEIRLVGAAQEHRAVVVVMPRWEVAPAAQRLLPSGFSGRYQGIGLDRWRWRWPRRRRDLLGGLLVLATDARALGGILVSGPAPRDRWCRVAAHRMAHLRQRAPPRSCASGEHLHEQVAPHGTKLRSPGCSARGGVWPTGRCSRRHRMAWRLLSLRPVAV